MITALAFPPAAPRTTPSQPLKLIVDRLSDRLAAHWCAQIESGALAPGDRLPTERELALAHGVSRTVVREAVHQLKSKALVQSRQGSGVFVAEPPAHQALAFDPAVLSSVQAVVHVVEVRRVLEGEIAALAAERASRAQIAALRRALKAIDAAAAAGQDGVAEDLAFHRVIGEATGNPQFRLLLGFLEQYLREGMRITRGNEARRRDFMEAVQSEHRAIFEAIAARDPAAARRRATEHLIRGEQRLVEGGIIDGRRRKAAVRAQRAGVPSPSLRKTTKATKESP
ncbi:FadR/GntR family transcriptional regulator [Variovorax sp. SRS16]|uniref:FadR/GntR family transcriptional regulator n=1 Tax=Variovorax sp. SRS16 TaxID=282217 RepID=UPI002F9612D9